MAASEPSRRYKSAPLKMTFGVEAKRLFSQTWHDLRFGPQGAA